MEEDYSCAFLSRKHVKSKGRFHRDGVRFLVSDSTVLTAIAHFPCCPSWSLYSASLCLRADSPKPCTGVGFFCICLLASFALSDDSLT